MAKIVMEKAEALAEGYSPFYRSIEIASILAFFIFEGVIFGKALPFWRASPWLTATALLGGWIGADFVAGFVHWAADTWGTTEWPVIGKALIRPFREHHVDQLAITRHDFIETNGSNCLLTLPFVGATAFAPLDPSEGFSLFALIFMFSIAFWVFMTNQIHKWAHLEEPSASLRLMHSLHLILPKDHHRIHHTQPYSRYYCITSGWLNYSLYKIGFFQTLEKTVFKVTGHVPRENDIGRDAALAMMRGQHVANSVITGKIPA